ncbi:beta-1,3-galactosyltransferase 1-like [Saccoglossus kowalevskii]|uniref:Hexosyltransferase n=1 Tax=Saccoglossus kowalevskii TaxID=10224 RepID=A0ABM0H1L9_SACKO|nr:PREDICTED: beta-1,3-galactosyltransferase 1-like [Saccoglossus kowalevskii]
MSTPSTVVRRSFIRNSRGLIREVDGYQIIQVFFTGMPSTNENFQILKKEHDLFSDIVVVDFVDSYNNLTLKTMVMLKWAVTYCPHVKYVMKVDDDVFINFDNLVGLLSNAQQNNYIVGHVYENAKPIRDELNKWYTSKYDWPIDNFPTYISGAAYVMSVDVAKSILQSACHMKMFIFEDVYVGLNLLNLSIKPTHHNGFDTVYVLLNHAVYMT